MQLREELARKIERKQNEIKELELKIREASAYIQGLQDMAKLLPKEERHDDRHRVILRPGTDIARAQQAIAAAGRPLHINAILEALGKPVEPKPRLALAGSLARYARQRVVFQRTAPNTFGLAEPLPRKPTRPEPPDDFGLDDVDE